MTASHYDVIVIGAGSMGAAACYQLAKRGYRVLGLEQFSIPHEQGSYTGQSRIIRKAYFEHPGYVPLLHRAYAGWREFEAVTNEKIFFKTGLLYHGPSDHPVIKGTKEAAHLHGIMLNNTEQYSRHFHLSKDNETIIEPDAGFLLAKKAVSLFAEEASKYQAIIKTRERVVQWEYKQDTIKVITDKNTYSGSKLIITAGPWAAKMIPGLTTSLKVTRQVIIWVKPVNSIEFNPADFPCWLIADRKREGALYGFPFLTADKYGEPEGMKFAWHHPGSETDADKVNREVTAEEVNELKNEVAAYIPAVADATVVAAKTCLYTNSSDENFIIDHLPGYNGAVSIACGFSGHGFKFVPVAGEILADLAMNGHTMLPIDFLRLKRFAH